MATSPGITKTTMSHFNRQIFTTRPTRLEVIADYALGAIIAVSLTMAALAFFDVL